MAVNNTYQAEVGIKFNDTQLNKQLKSLSDKTITVNAKLTGGATTQAKDLQNSLKEVTKSAKEVTPNLEKASKSSKSMGDNFNHSSRGGKTLASQFVDITKKVLAFGTATQAIMLFRQSVGEAVTVVRDLNDAQTEFSKVSDYSKEQLDSYTDSLDKLGASVYRNKIEMLEGATAFKKSGFSEEDSAILAKVSALYQNIADEQLSASDASEVIISQMKAFNMTANEAIHVIDSINQVSNMFAVSSGDIGRGLTSAGAALSTYGNSFEETIGLISAG